MIVKIILLRICVYNDKMGIKGAIAGLSYKTEITQYDYEC